MIRLCAKLAAKCRLPLVFIHACPRWLPDTEPDIYDAPTVNQVLSEVLK